MDVPLLIRHRLKELGTEQRGLAAAAQVTESYISQLLTGKKVPPAPERTDIYAKMETFLRFPAGKLATLADLQHKHALKSKLADPPAPSFREVRELILCKCAPGREKPIRAIFEKEAFGVLERLVTQKLLDVVKRVAKEELDDETWLRLSPYRSSRNHAARRTSREKRAVQPVAVPVGDANSNTLTPCNFAVHSNPSSNQGASYGCGAPRAISSLLPHERSADADRFGHWTPC